MVPYRKNQPDRKHIPHKRATTITDKRQRNTGNWKDPDGHPNILKNVEGNHTNHTHTNKRIKIILRLHTDSRNMINEQKEQADNDTRPYKPKLFTNNTKDKIRLPFW